MIRLCGGSLALVALLSHDPLGRQPAGEKPLPRVSISLPTGVLSETVQIHYFMTGPFGGVGDSVEPERNVHAYSIEAAYEGVAASRIKLIVYAPGCELATFDDALPGPSSVSEEFTCREIPTVSLAGKIVPTDTAGNRKPEVAIAYLAHWAHEFFGIQDGWVTTIRIATVVPNTEGLFEVQLPDFGRDPIASRPDREGEFEFWLREGNPIGKLEPADFKTAWGCLRIQSWYPQPLAFSLRQRP